MTPAQADRLASLADMMGLNTRIVTTRRGHGREIAFTLPNGTHTGATGKVETAVALIAGAMLAWVDGESA